jgi:hypothetical protein
MREEKKAVESCLPGPEHGPDTAQRQAIVTGYSKKVK